MKLDIKELQQVVQRLLSHLESRGIDEVELPNDLYWAVPESRLFDVASPPEDIRLDIGSLTDDWTFTRALLDEGTQPVAYQLTEVAPIIAALGIWAAEKLAGSGG